MEYELGNGFIAFVDEEDVEKIADYKWYGVRLRNTYYAQAHTKEGTTTYMHRVIMGVTDPKQQVDHINHSGLDNRKSNLRVVTATENARNRTKRATCTSQYKGVSLNKRNKLWEAYITIHYKKHRLGFFANEIDAALHYDKMARLVFGEHASCNFPPKKGVKSAIDSKTVNSILEQVNSGAMTMQEAAQKYRLPKYTVRALLRLAA